MFAIFGRVWAAPGSEVETPGGGLPTQWEDTVEASGGRAATPYITITRRDGREWVLTMDEVDHLIDTLTRLRKQYRKEVGR